MICLAASCPGSCLCRIFPFWILGGSLLQGARSMGAQSAIEWSIVFACSVLPGSADSKTPAHNLWGVPTRTETYVSAWGSGARRMLKTVEMCRSNLGCSVGG